MITAFELEAVMLAGLMNFDMSGKILIISTIFFLKSVSNALLIFD